MENENKVIISKEMMGDLIKLNKAITGLWAYITPEGNVYVYNQHNVVLLADCCTNGTWVYISFSLSKFIKEHKIKTPEELILMFKNERAGKILDASSYGGEYLYGCDIGTKEQDDKFDYFKRAFSGVADSCRNTVTKETVEKLKNLLPFMHKDASKYSLQGVFLVDGIMASTDAYSMLCYEGMEFNGVPAEGFALEKTAVEVIVKFGCTAFGISQNKDFTYIMHERFILSSYKRECNTPRLEVVTASKDKCDRTADASSLVSFLHKNIRTIEERGYVKFSEKVEILEILDAYKRQKTLETFGFDGLEAEFYINGGYLKKVIPFLKNRQGVNLNYTAGEYIPVNFSFDGGRVYITKVRDI